MRRRMRRRAGEFALVAAMVVLPACGDGGEPARPTAGAEAASTLAPVETTARAVDTTLAPARTTTSVTAPPARAAVLTVGPGALGPYALGALADDVLAGVTAALGEPSDDTGWGEQQAPCDGLGERSRYVRWGWVWAHFSNGPTAYAAAGVEHLMAFGVVDPDDGSADPGAVDEAGAPLLGATVAELKQRYPEAEVYDAEIQGPAYALKNGLAGSVSNVADDGIVTSVYAGLVCID